MFKKKDVITWRPWYLLRRHIKPTSVSALLCDPRTLHARCEFRQHYKPLLRKGPYGPCYARKLTSIYSPQQDGDYIFSPQSTHFLKNCYPAANTEKWVIFLRFLGVNVPRIWATPYYSKGMADVLFKASFFFILR